jgi:FAD/FMN-containing dehydrogenase
VVTSPPIYAARCCAPAVQVTMGRARSFNGMIHRRPALIARCAGAADVIAAVQFAREHNLITSIKGGGHNISGNAVCDGGLMIDLSPMKSVRVDPVKRVARAEAGLT